MREREEVLESRGDVSFVREREESQMMIGLHLFSSTLSMLNTVQQKKLDYFSKIYIYIYISGCNLLCQSCIALVATHYRIV